MAKHEVAIDLGGKSLRIETGRMARLAAGSVVVTFGETMVLSGASVATPREGIDFFPLTLDYRDGQWMYRDYRASTTDMRDGTVAEIDGSRTAAIQPTIVSILGIKTAPDRIEHE